MNVYNMKVILIMSILASMLLGCASPRLPQITKVPQVDLPKFMGNWYVIAAIPTMIETESYNAVESYALDKDGSIKTTFTFNQGSLNGKLKTYKPRGFVIPNTGNALWDMQFIWPIKAEYIITYLNEDYTKTIIARNKRDFVWIMARTPTISEAEYQELTSLIAKLGYDLSLLRKVPHNQIESQ
jgi:apolipoprotein D and lipocalin family protein